MTGTKTARLQVGAEGRTQEGPGQSARGITKGNKMQNVNPANWKIAGLYYCGDSAEMREAYAEETSECIALIEKHGKHAEARDDELGACDHCGTFHSYGVLFSHKSEPGLITVGNKCAANNFGCVDKVDRKRKQAQRQAQKAREERIAFWSAIRFLSKQKNRKELCAFLRVDSCFAKSLRFQLFARGWLSKNQIDSAFDAAERMTAREIEEKESQVEKIPAPSGRVHIQGKVLSIYPKETQFGTIWKMVVLAQGFKVWLTLPKAIDNAEAGDIVEFTASLEPSKKDKSFAFGKRPTKAKIILMGD